MPDPEVTAVVPVKDRRERMLRCLEALLSQDHPSYEVIILDNCSSDGTGDACRAASADAPVPVRVERVEGTLGEVRNHGARLARGHVIAYTDSDCVPAPGWLREGCAALSSDQSLGLVCGRTSPAEPPAARWPNTVLVDRYTWRFESCNIFYRAPALLASEGFDEVVGDGWEDTAAGFGVLRGGWRGTYAARALVHHDVTYPGFWWHVRREQRQRNLARILRRYPEARRRLLWAGLFLRPRDAAFVLAVLGVLLGRGALALPYLPFALRRRRPLEAVVLDAAVNLAVMRGAVRHRAVVL